MNDFGEYFPHLENCTEIIQSEHGVSLRVLIDTTKHLYLGDHVFGGKCFVPATMIMELLMEAALWHNRRVLNQSGFFPVQLENINIERAIAIAQGDSAEVIIDFLSVTETDGRWNVSLKVSSARQAVTGEKIGTRINTTALVILADHYPAAPAIQLPNRFKESSDIPGNIYYDYYFPSLGYLFHSCTGNFRFDPQQKIFLGVYNCSNKENHFIKNGTAGFLSSPLGNDSCLQYAVFFSRILALKGRLPIGGKEFLVFKRHPLDGAVHVFIQCLHIDDELMIFDFYSFDDQSFIAAGKEFKVKKSPFHREFGHEEFFHIINQYKKDR